MRKNTTFFAIQVNEDINTLAIRIEEFDYELPDERIARHPLAERDRSKLLVYDQEKIHEDVFCNAVNYLPENAMLVYNNTRVIQARMVFHKESGARIELFCLEPITPSDYVLSLGATNGCSWKCMVGNLKKWKTGKLQRLVELNDRQIVLTAEKGNSLNNTHEIHFSWNDQSVSFAEILDHAGELPIPPYLKRDTEEGDKTAYQTVYSRIKGSVAAPTAGLHFTEAVLDSLKTKNICIEELTLHVGAGTFQPVKTSDIAEHDMHTEVISVQRAVIERLFTHSGHLIAVGTTSVRTLESLYFIGLQLHNKNANWLAGIHVGQWEPYTTECKLSKKEALKCILEYLDTNGLQVLHAQTQIMIRPGYRFQLVEGMFTNFHQPKSTLLLLVSAFTNNRWRTIYDYAMNNNFRFLSYGDSSLLLNLKENQ